MKPTYIMALCFVASVTATPVSPPEERLENTENAEGNLWAYYLPSYTQRKESKDPDGTTTGAVYFINSDGSPLRWIFTANGAHGFKVYQEDVSPERYLRDSSNAALNRQNAIDLGVLTYKGTGDRGHEVYFVDQDIVDAAGSESQLAFNLGAIPASAIHDGQGSPLRHSPNNAAIEPLLVPHQDGTYTVEVPVPHGAQLNNVIEV